MKLKFEKVSDINDEYCHLDVSHDEKQTAFMDVSVGEDKKPLFSIYIQNAVVSLTHEEWKEILSRAEVFVEKEISNENSFKECE